MNRNNERHFNKIPQMKASRTRFNRDQTILTTFDAGKTCFSDNVFNVAFVCVAFNFGLNINAFCFLQIFFALFVFCPNVLAALCFA